MIALLNLSVLGFSFVVFHDKAKRTQEGDLLGHVESDGCGGHDKHGGQKT